MKKTKLSDCNTIELQRINERNGSLTPVENYKDIPFITKRIFYIYDIPSGESRGAHAHKECHQFLVAVAGSFNVMLNDGKSEDSVLLDKPYKGLHIPPGIWASEMNFSSGSICLVLASDIYNEDDYLRKYKDFKKWKSKK